MRTFIEHRQQLDDFVKNNSSVSVRKFSNPWKEVGEPPKKFNKKGRPSLVGEELLIKIKEMIIEI